MGSLETFEGIRPRLKGLAYRMLASVSDTEDIVQDAWIRWQAVDETKVDSPGAWLSATVTRLCLDRLKAARLQRERYIGPWLPDPVATVEPTDPETISMGFLLLLERLTPQERAALLLHDVFEYSHVEIGALIGVTDVAARQAYHRAKSHMQQEPRFAASREKHRELLLAFQATMLAGDVAGLTKLLAEDATACADSGGKVRGAARKPIQGAPNIARFFVGLVANIGLSPAQTLEVIDVNGWPAIVGKIDGTVNAVLTIEVDGDLISTVRNIVNPEKLSLPTWH
jgi:RNA polymerase sigma-70 factor, ECF subfamily